MPVMSFQGDHLSEETLALIGAKKQPVSYQEENLAYIIKSYPTNPTNHLSKAIEINGAVDENALSISISKIVTLNPNLRSFYQLKDHLEKYEIPTDFNKNEFFNLSKFSQPKLDIIDVTDKDEDSQKQVLEKTLAKTYAIDEFPLMRAHLIKISNKKSYLVLSMSHMVGDGYSAFLIFGLVECIYNFIVKPIPQTNKELLNKFLFGLSEVLYHHALKPIALRINPRFQNWANEKLADLYCSTMQTIAKSKLLPYTKMCERQQAYRKNLDHPGFLYFGRLSQYSDFKPTAHLRRLEESGASTQTAITNTSTSTCTDINGSSYGINDSLGEPYEITPSTDLSLAQIHLFTTEIPKEKVMLLNKLAKRYNAQTPRLLLALFHLTLYSYSKKACAVRTINHHRRSNEVYSIGYYAQDMVSFCGNLKKDHTFKQIISAVKDHLLIQKNLDENSLRPAQIPASLCFNQAGKPLKTEFNFMKDMSFKLNLKRLKTKSDNNLQSDSINTTWYAPIKGKYGYDIELSMYVNQSDDQINIQIMSAKRAYPEDFGKEFFETYLDNIKRGWFLNDTPIGALCKTDASDLVLPDLEDQDIDTNQSWALSPFKKLRQSPAITACLAFGVICAANYYIKHQAVATR